MIEPLSGPIIALLLIVLTALSGMLLDNKCKLKRTTKKYDYARKQCRSLTKQIVKLQYDNATLNEKIKDFEKQGGKKSGLAGSIRKIVI